MYTNSITAFLAFVLACAAAAAPGFLCRPGTWYRDLVKPSWRPPDWLFGPVWLVLYVSIAVSGWLVWRQVGLSAATLAFVVYGSQLILNGFWSVIFFGLHRPGFAFVEILCLWISIAATIAVFHPIDPLAAYLLVPYACWVGFAVVLNYRIWRLNPAHASSSSP